MPQWLKRLSWRLVAGLACGTSSLFLSAEDVPPETPIVASDREHWAFQPLSRPAVPNDASQLVGQPENPVDQFIAARLRGASLRFAPLAEKRDLLRRVTFDLTGLPPTPDDVANFVNDDAPDAYERAVERLLASPAYGERWAQHWLDLARFAETDGFEHDKVRPEAWRFRDWVIDAFNQDLPFDEFARRQLAGDELGDEHRIASGFLVCGPDMPDLNRQEERRADFLNDLTGTVGAVYLGLQLGCAQCHDHKTDPVSQYDFYRLRAFFDRAFDFKRDVLMTPPQGNRFDQPSQLLIRGDFRRLGPTVRPAFLRIANPDSAEPQATENGKTLRLELARWITSPQHPLTTRVLANRLWLVHFGRGLSETPSDFGLLGERPVQLELLNWLATEIPHQQWSLKAMHRLLVTSRTYRQTSRLSATATETEHDHWQRAVDRDPLLRLHSRGSRRRLDGEVIHDTLLAVSGQLSQRRGGPGIRPPLPTELVQTLLKNQWPVSENPEDWQRRAVYLFVRRNLRIPLLEAFDKPDPNLSCPRRTRSTIAPQALLLMNAEQSHEAARTLALRARDVAGDSVDARINWLFQQLLSRPPTPGELTEMHEFLQANGPENFAALCLVMLNLNEFVYVD